MEATRFFTDSISSALLHWFAGNMIREAGQYE
jgi:hypothetical protein